MRSPFQSRSPGSRSLSSGPHLVISDLAAARAQDIIATMEKASTADMVKDAIKTLRERGGSSLHNIKKYIEAVYQVDMRYRAPHIRKFLRAAVSEGGVVQTRGKGASGSFKLPPRQAAAALTPSARSPAPARRRKANAHSARAGTAARARASGGRERPRDDRPSRRAEASSSKTSLASSRSSTSLASSTSSAASRSARDERAKMRDLKRWA